MGTFHQYGFIRDGLFLFSLSRIQERNEVADFMVMMCDSILAGGARGNLSRTARRCAQRARQAREEATQLKRIRLAEQAPEYADMISGMGEEAQAAIFRGR